MIILAYTLSGLSLLMSVLFLIRIKFPLGFFTVWIPKLIAGALSPYWATMGIVSFYPPTDLKAMYQYKGQHRLVNLPPVPIGPDSTTSRSDFGRMDILLGGWPQDIPDTYQMGSPATHVHPGSPPTLLVQGSQDVLVPVEPTRSLYIKLVESGVPAINIIYPWTNHAFDLLLPQINPAAQSALYDVDRFLALLLNQN